MSYRFAIMATILIGHGTLLAYGAWRHSPTWDEIGHLPAGISHWRLGRFDLYCVNPPLVRMVAALPLVALGTPVDWRRYSLYATDRAEFQVGADFVGDRRNRDQLVWLFALARWACIPFGLLSGFLCWLWASRLYGPNSGLLALLVWCLCPNALAYGQLLTPDIGAAAVGMAASYSFWRWLRAPTWWTTFITGILLGLAELTKTTWIILFGLWPLLLLFWLAVTPPWPRGEGRWRSLKLLLIFGLAVDLLNVGYGFEGSFTKIGDYTFKSDLLRKPGPKENATGNRFTGTWLGLVPVPLPKNYLQGIDTQKVDFDKRLWSYLRGEWKLGGWYHYYLYAFLIKEPLGILLLGILAALATIYHRYLTDPSLVTLKQEKRNNAASFEAEKQMTWRDEVVLLAPAFTLFIFVSSQTGFNHHLRYLLPAFPFFFVWISKIGCYAHLADFYPKTNPLRANSQHQRLRRLLTVSAGIALSWTAYSSLRVYPHSLSYFNELVGGPENGHLHLGNSNVDWGQDLFFLQEWYQEHWEARPLHLAYDLPLMDPTLSGIESLPVPAGPPMNRAGYPTTKNWPWVSAPIPSEPPLPGELPLVKETPRGPLPGWFIISHNLIHRREGCYEYFQEFDPIDRIGLSMNVYHITVEEANRVREKLALPPLSSSRSELIKPRP